MREIVAPFVVSPAVGVSIRTRLKGLTDSDVRVLREVGEHLGRLAAGDLARRVRDGLRHDKDAWAERKRDLTPVSSARWAGSITRVSVVRGGKRLLRTRHHLDQAGMTQARWRERWEAARWFLSADGESGKKHGNETIRVTPAGEVSLRLPAALMHLANAAHGRYVLSGRVCFAYRGAEWGDRAAGNRAVAYRIHYAVEKRRWYVDASWQREPIPAPPLESLRARQVIGVDMNTDHLAAWRLDSHGNPIGAPRTFGYDLSAAATHRDAQVRHALTRLLHWAKQAGAAAIAVEDLDFTGAKSRELHGGRRRFRQTISGIPTAKLRCPAAVHVRGGRDRRDRRGPRIHQQVGCSALAAPDQRACT